MASQDAPSPEMERVISGNAIRGFEWASLVVAVICAAFCLTACCYVLPRLSQSAFNDIWKTRFLLQLTAFGLAASQLLPLQLWGAREGVTNVLHSVKAKTILCKVFTVTALGVLQPFLLLLAGFMCSFALRDPYSRFYKWHRPALLALLCTLPFAAGQVLCAWWSVWLEGTLDDDNEIGALSFASYSPVPCPQAPRVSAYAKWRSSKCIACKYSFCTLIVHLALTCTFVSFLIVFGRRLLRLCGNAALRRRVWLLCVLLPALQALQTLAAAVTVIRRRPLKWAHEAGDFAALVFVAALIVATSALLVIWPLRSASRALHHLSKLDGMHSDSDMAADAPLVDQAETKALLEAPSAPMSAGSSMDATHASPLVQVKSAEAVPAAASGLPPPPAHMQTLSRTLPGSAVHPIHAQQNPLAAARRSGSAHPPQAMALAAHTDRAEGHDSAVHHSQRHAEASSRHLGRVAQEASTTKDAFGVVQPSSNFAHSAQDMAVSGRQARTASRSRRSRSRQHNAAPALAEEYVRQSSMYNAPWPANHQAQ